MSGEHLLVDSHGRVMRDLRVSVTDRCNFRCLYCLPETEAAHNFYRGRWANVVNPPAITHHWAPRSSLLTFEEIERFVRVAASLGIEKIRLTGGEPLLRRDLEKLIALLSRIDGVKDLALTTNGFQFQAKAETFLKAGLRRVSFSLDSLDRDNFRKITGRDGLNEVLAAIRMAQALGYHPVKVNAVIIRGINDHEIEALVEFGRQAGVVFRFIEFMPLDSGRVWLKDLVVPGREILERLHARFTLKRLPAAHPSETAVRWGFADSPAEIGIIAPVSEPFCGHCNRIRLTADGQVRTCLFSVHEHDARGFLRSGAEDVRLQDWLRGVVGQKEKGHRIGEPDFVPASRSMSCIGG